MRALSVAGTKSPSAGGFTTALPTHVYTLELGLEPLKITDIPLDQRLPSCGSDVLPQGVCSGRSVVFEGIGIVESCGVVPSNPVGDGVDDFEVLGKGPSGDLVIVSRVAPPTEPALWGIVEDCCVGKVGARIYRGGGGGIECQRGQNTDGVSQTDLMSNPNMAEPLDSRIRSLTRPRSR